jgi:hypothetical protein
LTISCGQCRVKLCSRPGANQNMPPLRKLQFKIIYTTLLITVSSVLTDSPEVHYARAIHLQITNVYCTMYILNSTLYRWLQWYRKRRVYTGTSSWFYRLATVCTFRDDRKLLVLLKERERERERKIYKNKFWRTHRALSARANPLGRPFTRRGGWVSHRFWTGRKKWKTTHRSSTHRSYTLYYNAAVRLVSAVCIKYNLFIYSVHKRV